MHKWDFLIFVYAWLEPVLKILIAELSESVEKFTKSYKGKNFFSRDFLFLKLEASILAFAKETTFAVQVLDSPRTTKLDGPHSESLC